MKPQKHAVTESVIQQSYAGFRQIGQRVMAGCACAVYAVTSVAFGDRHIPFETTVTVHAEQVLGPISPLIYGQYLEHVQESDECIYPSLWDEKSPHANKAGLRMDVVKAVSDLNVPIVRWPGGCFADVYHWMDGIGPQSSRVAQPNLHWGGTESNRFGTDEFLQWCQLSRVVPYINVNLGSGTLEEALSWLEYCNGDVTTTEGKRRAANGQAEPYKVRYWGIGNETWGEWETGHTDAHTYGTMLKKWARAMRKKDPAIKIFGVGSEEGNDREWDRTVLGLAGDEIDYLTMHMYGISTTYGNGDQMGDATVSDEYDAFVLTPAYLETRLRRMIETIEETTAPRHNRGPIRISVDEWNIRHFINGKQNRWSPRNLQDALFSAGVLNSMIRLSPHVGMANYVFLVNGNGTLLVKGEQIVRTPLAHLFKQYADWMTGSAVAVTIDGPQVTPPPPMIAHPGRKPGPEYPVEPVPVVDAAAARRTDGTIVVALINRDASTTATVSLDLPKGYVAGETWRLHHENVYAVNDFDSPEKVVPLLRRVHGSVILCPPHSVVMAECRK